MKNCMNEVAKLLGIELNEKFVVGNDTYKLTPRGLVMDECEFIHGALLTTLLTGEIEIKQADHKPWRPEFNKTYYFVNEDGRVCEIAWWGDSVDVMRYKLGNCYCDPRAAEINADKWKAFYASDEVLEI